MGTRGALKVHLFQSIWHLVGSFLFISLFFPTKGKLSIQVTHFYFRLLSFPYTQPICLGLCVWWPWSILPVWEYELEPAICIKSVSGLPAWQWSYSWSLCIWVVRLSILPQNAPFLGMELHSSVGLYFSSLAICLLAVCTFHALEITCWLIQKNSMGWWVWYLGEPGISGDIPKVDTSMETSETSRQWQWSVRNLSSAKSALISRECLPEGKGRKTTHRLPALLQGVWVDSCQSPSAVHGAAWKVSV